MVTARRQSGFTLAEMLVVISIVGILAAIAIPSMGRMLQSQAVRTASYDLIADMTYARSEAITRSSNITLSANSGTNFNKGWTVKEGTTVLRTQGARTADINFTGTTTTTFDKTGRVVVGAGGSWAIYPNGSDVQDHDKRCLRLDPSGKPRSIEGDTCS